MSHERFPFGKSIHQRRLASVPAFQTFHSVQKLISGLILVCHSDGKDEMDPPIQLCQTSPRIFFSLHSLRKGKQMMLDAR